MITSVSTLSWEDPDSNTDYIPGDYTLNVSGDSANASNNVDFYYDQGNGWEEISTGVSGSSDGDYWTVEGVDGNLGTVENLELKANFSSGPDYGDTTTVTLDKGGPDSFQLNTPGDYADSEDPTVEVEVTDDYSGVQNISVTVEDSNNDEIDSTECDSTTECELDLSDLSNGDTYDVEVLSFDKVDNQNSDTLSFTVDTSYDGPEDFSYDPSPGIIDVDQENREIEVELDQDNDDTDLDDVECQVDGAEEDTFDIDSSADSGDTYTCDIPDDFDGQMFDLELYLEDQAGNSFTADSEEFGFDAYSPTVDSLESSMDVSSFGDDFDMEYTVSDDVSDVETVEYYIGEDPGEGEVNESRQLNESSGEFTVDTSDLGEDEHTLYLRAEDEFGKWSSTESFDFNFYPDESPEASMDVADELNITSGSTEGVDVTLENTGRILVPSGEVTISGFGGNESFESFAPGESKTVEIDLSPSDENLGENELDVTVSSVDVSSSISVLVEADSETQDELQSSLDEQVSQYENLSSQVESLRPELSQGRKDRLNSDFSKLKSSIEEARNAAESGEYYRVDELMSDLSNQVQATQETYNTVKKEQQVDDRNMIIMIGAGILLLLIGGGIGFVMHSDEYEFDIDLGSDSDEDVSVSDDEDSEGLVDKVKSKIEELKGGEDESDEPEYEFK